MRIAFACVIVVLAVAGCEGPAGEQGPMGPAGPQGEQGAQGPPGDVESEVSVFYLDFTLSSDSYSNGVLTLRDSRISPDRFLGLAFRATVAGNPVLMPLAYPAAMISDFKFEIAGKVQVVVQTGSVVVTDADRELLGYASGFVSTSGASSISLSVAILE